MRTDDLSYMGLRLAGFGGELVGIDGLTFGIYNGLVLVNQAKDAAAPTATPDKTDGPVSAPLHASVAGMAIPQLASAWKILLIFISRVA